MDLVSFFMNCLSNWLWCTLLLLIICTFVWIYGRIIRFSAILYILYTFLSTVASCEIVCCWLLQWNMLYTFVPATRFSEDQNPNPGATCLCKVNVQFFACKLPIVLCNWYTWCETYPTPCLFSGRIGMVSVANAVIRQENVLALWKGLVPVSLFSLALKFPVFITIILSISVSCFSVVVQMCPRGWNILFIHPFSQIKISVSIENEHCMFCVENALYNWSHFWYNIMLLADQTNNVHLNLL